MKRGDVVVVQFPYADGNRGKNRPALIVQNDRDNRRLANTIIAMITGNLQHSAEPTHVLVDPASTSGSSSGLHGKSVVKCCNLFTVRQQDILKVIGSLSDELQVAVDSGLKHALGLSNS